mmetsp:Transcript_19826/g.40262  ORF Transcript_19826/g.40262 Transcript_19826/m.40262 type:complete len:382 (-) Transcript_19826:359-1504(-)
MGLEGLPLQRPMLPGGAAVLPFGRKAPLQRVLAPRRPHAWPLCPQGTGARWAGDGLRPQGLQVRHLVVPVCEHPSGALFRRPASKSHPSTRWDPQEVLSWPEHAHELRCHGGRSVHLQGLPVESDMERQWPSQGNSGGSHRTSKTRAARGGLAEPIGLDVRHRSARPPSHQRRRDGPAHLAAGRARQRRPGPRPAPPGLRESSGPLGLRLQTAVAFAGTAGQLNSPVRRRELREGRGAGPIRGPRAVRRAGARGREAGLQEVASVGGRCEARASREGLRPRARAVRSIVVDLQTLGGVLRSRIRTARWGIRQVQHQPLHGSRARIAAAATAGAVDALSRMRGSPSSSRLPRTIRALTRCRRAGRLLCRSARRRGQKLRQVC